MVPNENGVELGVEPSREAEVVDEVVEVELTEKEEEYEAVVVVVVAPAAVGKPNEKAEVVEGAELGFVEEEDPNEKPEDEVVDPNGEAEDANDKAED